jgi:hypothetical protein
MTPGIAAPDDPGQRETPPAITGGGHVNQDDRKRGGTRGHFIARLTGRIYARVPARQDAAGARHGRRRR